MSTSTHAKRFTKGKKSRKTHINGHQYGTNRNAGHSRRLFDFGGRHSTQYAMPHEEKVKLRAEVAKAAKKAGLVPGDLVRMVRKTQRDQMRADHVAAVLRGEDPKVRVQK